MNVFSGEDLEIQTPRLLLATVLPAEYDAMVNAKALPEMWADRGILNPNRVLVDDGGPLPFRIPRILKNPDYAPFALRLAVLKESRVIIGSSGFHDFPDSTGMIEIGLGVEPLFRRQGFAMEMLHGMWGWVIANPEVKTLRYTVSITNEPSIAMVKKLDFTCVGQQIDEEDGPEDIYEMSAIEYRRRYFHSSDSTA